MSLRLTLLLTVFVFIGLPVLGQNDSRGATIIYIDGGLLWVHNEDGAHFLVEIKGDEVKPMQQAPFINVNGRPMQLHFVPIEKFLSVEKPRPKDGVILRAHQDWEIEYHSKLVNTKLTPRSETIRFGADREALFWDYPNPPQSRVEFPQLSVEFAAQSFLTTAIGKHLLILNAPLRPTEPPNAAKDFLVAILSTLQVSPRPIDIKALQEFIRKTNGKVPALGQLDKKEKP